MLLFGYGLNSLQLNQNAKLWQLEDCIATIGFATLKVEIHHLLLFVIVY